MALVMAGGVVGFWAAVAAYFMLGLGALPALALWAASGPIAAAVALLLASSRSASQAAPAQAPAGAEAA